MAAKPPSFPFYGQDFQTGTMAFTPAERGVYLDCLWHQWASGGVPADDAKRLAQVMRCSPADAKKYWPALAPKFVKGDDGLYRNPRLEAVRADKQAWHDSRKKNGAKGERPPKHETTSEPSGSGNGNLEVPLSFSSSSEPTVQEEPRATAGPFHRGPKRHGDPWGTKQFAAGDWAAMVDLGEGRVIQIPDKWADPAKAAYKLSADDIRKFASDLGVKVRAAGGVVDDTDPRTRKPNRWSWFDRELAAWRDERVRPNDGLEPASEWIARHEAEVAAITSTPEESRAALREGFRRGR